MEVSEDSIKCEQVGKLSTLEKPVYDNIHQEYVMEGIAAQEPDFLVSNKENDSETVDKTNIYIKYEQGDKLSELEKINNACDIMQHPLQEYNICEEKFEFCVGCGMSLHILDNDVSKGTRNRVNETLPRNLLEIKQSPIHEHGVFALEIIPEDIKFGPYEGLETIMDHAWKIKDGRFVDTSDVKFSNWMRYVNCARNVQEQNMIAFQHEGGLYYRCIKTVDKGEELLVFYGEQFTKVENVFVCSSCCLVFSSKEYFEKHMTTCAHQIIKEEPVKESLQCQFCNIYVTDKENLKNHVEYCGDRSTGELSNYCNDISVEIDASSTSKRHKCFECGYQTKKVSHFKRHLQIHNGLRPVECRLCDKKFRCNSSLKRHLAVHASEEREGKPQCYDCGYTCKDKVSLIIHIKHKHSMMKDVSSMKKKFKCIKCQYQTDYKAQLEIHVKIHENAEPLECAMCNKEFENKNDLKRHLIIHSERQQFQCRNCPFVCNSKSNLNGHMKRKHYKNKEHSCNICSYQCVARCDLIRHVRTHTKERPFQCYICKKKFPRQNDLRRHVDTHSDIRIQCPKCSFTTHNKRNINLHCKNKHK